MENLISATVEIALDGKPYKLRYRAWAFICYAEKVGGDLLADLTAVGRQLQQPPDENGVVPISRVMGKLRDVLWAGLTDAHPELTRDQLARMFGVSDLNSLTPAIAQAIGLAMPRQDPARPTLPVIALPAISNGSSDSGQSSETVAVSVPANLPH